MCGLGLADTGGADEKQGPNWSAPISEAGEIGPGLRSNPGQSVVLTDDPSAEGILERDGSSARISDHGADRDPGEIGDNTRNIIVLELLGRIAVSTSNTGAGTSGVKNRNGLARKASANDVTLSKGNSALDRTGVDGDPVMCGKPFGHALEDGKRLVHVRLVDPHWSHTAGKP